MATVTSTFPTLVDVAKRMDPNGSIAFIAELLSKYLPILEDMAWQEGNLPTGHRYTARAALPSVGSGLSWRRFNQGLDPTVSKTEQYDEVCGMLEGYSKVDVDLAKLNGNEQAFRLSEDKAFIQGFNIAVANALFYESVTNAPERITGLTPRLNSTSTTTDPAGVQVVKCDGSASGANQTSIWLIGWSPETIFGIFPKGSQAGLQTEDLGKQLVLDGSSKQFLAWVTRWQWKLGLCVRDYRFVARVCNIDVNRWASGPAVSNFNSDLAISMQDAISKIYNLDVVRPVFYMNRATYAMLNKQLVVRQANWLEWLDQGGRRIPAYMGIPIKYVDAITSTESVVS